MARIKVKDQTYNLNFETQLSSDNGRPFRLSGVSLVTTKPQVWIDEIKAYRHGTIYHFVYLDNYGEFFGFEFDAKNKFICKI